MSQIELTADKSLWHPAQVRMIDMTIKVFLSIPCPTCGVAIGQNCLRHSGGLRAEPHLDRKLVAAEALDDARAGVQSLAELWPGKYVIYDEATGEGVSITRASSSRRGGLEV